MNDLGDGGGTSAPVLPSNISRKQQTSDKGITSPQSPLHLHGTSSREFPDLTDVVNDVPKHLTSFWVRKE